MNRLARQRHNPLWRRRAGDACLPLAAALAAAASMWGGAALWILTAASFVASVWLVARATDALLTFRFPGIKKRCLYLAGGGILVAFLVVVVRNNIPAEIAFFLISLGLGTAAGNGLALVWHYAATYAGDRIVHLSDEDW